MTEPPLCLDCASASSYLSVIEVTQAGRKQAIDNKGTLPKMHLFRIRMH